MTYDLSWDCPHQPGIEDDWQESDCYWFYDASSGVGGYHRIGQKPNRRNGQVTLFAFKVGGERYTRNDAFTLDRPIDPATDRWQDGHRVDGHEACALGGGRMRYRWEEADCSAELEFYESFHTPRGWSTAGHEEEFMQAMNPGGHLECSGRIRGTVRIGNDSYPIDGLAHRDRSWGFRDFAHFDYHRFRMYSGTVGPELSFATFKCDTANGPTVAGYVVRNGVDEDVVDLNVHVTLDGDGLASHSGMAVMTLASGEIIRVPCRAIQGYTTEFPRNNSFLVDTISEVSYAGCTGFCDFVHSTNWTRGVRMPTQADTNLLAVDRGLSRSTTYDL